MITVFYDKDNLYMGNADYVVSTFCDYSKGYAIILNAIYENGDAIVVVRNRQCFRSYQDMKEYYKNGTIQFKTFSARSEFLEKYGEEMPDYVLDSDLHADKSYLEIDFSSGEGFENTILRYYFDKFLVGKTFPYKLLGDMCKNMSLDCLQNKEMIILRKVFKKRMRDYTSSAKGKCEEFILNEFKDDYIGLRNNVSLYLIIKNYPKEFVEDVIGHDLMRCFHEMKVSGERIDLQKDILDTYRDRMKLFLKAKDIKDKEGFTQVIFYFSGYYTFEFDWCMKKLGDNPNFLDEVVYDHIGKAFASLISEDMTSRMKYYAMRAPVNLDKPSDNFEIIDWLNWAMKSYLPYKFWLEDNNKSNHLADEYATSYGDWVFTHYDKIISSYPDIMYKILPGLKQEFLGTEHSLFVILDNFNYKLKHRLEEKMSDAGYGISYERPILAMIPTETTISKRAFFTGEAYNENKQSYEKLVQSWTERMDVSMRYLFNVGELKSLSSFDEKVIFLNFLEIDKKLHQDSESSAIRVEEAVQMELDALISIIDNVLRRLGREKNTAVYFIADHGSTKILPEQENYIDPSYYKGLQEESDYRFIAVNDTDFDRTKKAIGNLCYTFSRDRYNTEYNYFIARGYNRFIKSNLKAYVHGGITPEESIVPFMKYEYITAICKKPEITLDNIELRYSALTQLSFTVKNFNDFLLKDVSIEIKNRNIKFIAVDQIDIDGSRSAKILIPDVRISKAMDKSNNEKMFVILRWNSNGKKGNQEIELPMNMKSMQQSKEDLSDLF